MLSREEKLKLCRSFEYKDDDQAPKLKLKAYDQDLNYMQPLVYKALCELNSLDKRMAKEHEDWPSLNWAHPKFTLFDRMRRSTVSLQTTIFEPRAADKSYPNLFNALIEAIELIRTNLP